MPSRNQFRPRISGYLSSSRRTARYWLYRLLRADDGPHRIARGVFAGTFIAFTPFFGLHYLLAPALAYIIRGNLIASLVFANVSNPLTFPIIAAFSIALGRTLLGRTEAENGPRESTGDELFSSLQIFGQGLGEGTTSYHWDVLLAFLDDLLLPYLLGGSLFGLAAGLVAAGAIYRLVPRFAGHLAAISAARRKRRALRRARKQGAVD